jgi:hypothetical protein
MVDGQVSFFCQKTVHALHAQYMCQGMHNKCVGSRGGRKECEVIPNTTVEQAQKSSQFNVIISFLFDLVDND